MESSLHKSALESGLIIYFSLLSRGSVPLCFLEAVGQWGKQSNNCGRLCGAGSVVNNFWCIPMINWVLKLFSFHVIMSKERIDSSGGR